MVFSYEANSTVEVAIGEDDEGRFAAKFEWGFLQIGIGARSHHNFARFRAAGEAQFAHHRMVRQRLADYTP